MAPKPHSSAPSRPIAIANWLLVVAALVVLMVAVGGITRLTESGLSITQWKPITGAIPPLSEAAWQAEFDLYRRTGEYINVTGPAGMDLAAFKFIYFWEWFHRLLGRVIGLAFAAPLASASALPMPTDWLPCPGNRNARIIHLEARSARKSAVSHCRYTLRHKCR